MKQNHILYGGDYNPEQWLDMPEILEKDIEYMKEAGINTVTMGMFSWAVLEKEEGKYNLDWLEKIVERLYKNGISTIMSTPSGARPKWLSDKYPEVLRVNEYGIRNRFGGRHNHCYTSSVYRKKTAQINQKLAGRLRNNPAVILWHISNEYGGQCFCPLCQEAFRKWLKEKYQTIDRLNDCWCTTFWSHCYQSFDQIEAPSPFGEQALHGLTLDWNRFVTDQTADFAKEEINVLRQAGINLPVTFNLMYDYQGLNYDKLALYADVISWDSYPVWHKGEDIAVARDNGFQHDYMRSLKHRPFLMMESSPSATNWHGISKLKRPGLLAAAGMQALAHGSDSVLYFQIRQSRGASEKFHGAVIDHYGGNDTRVFKEVKTLGHELARLGELAGAAVEATVAVIYDCENRWAMEAAQGPRNDGLYYHEAVMKTYCGLKRLGLNVDVISQNQDLYGYRLVAVPMLYLFREGVEGRLKDFVEQGGNLVMTYWSGVVDENDRCFLGKTPHGLTDVLGLRRTEIDGLYENEVNYLVPEKGEWNRRKNSEPYECRNLCELVDAEDAQVLLVYEDGFYRGTPAAARHDFGRGTAWYVAADVQQRFYDDLYELAAKNAGICPILTGKIPEGVEVTSRVKDGWEYVFIQNFNREPVDISGMNRDGMLLYGELIQNSVKDRLGAYETLILKRKQQGN